MKKVLTAIAILTLLTLILPAALLPLSASDGEANPAPEEEETATEAGAVVSSKALAAALAIGLACVAGALSMGMAIGKAVDGISRQPAADGKIRSSLMLGLVFIETVIIYALITVILIIFVL